MPFFEDLQRVGLQPNPVEEDEPVERDNLRPGITSYLDHEASERKAIYDRLVAIENAMKRRGSRGVRPLPCRDLNWCCRHIGLAILRRCNQADNRYTGPGTWLVAAGQAADRYFDSVDWLDEATGRSRKASGTPCAASVRRPLHRPGAGAADGPRSCHTAANCGATRSRSKQAGGRRRGNS